MMLDLHIRLHSGNKQGEHPEDDQPTGRGPQHSGSDQQTVRDPQLPTSGTADQKNGRSPLASGIFI